MGKLGKELRRLVVIGLFAAVACLQAGCGYVAAGAVGAAVGHEAAEEDDDD